MGMCLYFKGDLIEYRSAKVKGCCPIQSEALALKSAIYLVRGRGVNCCFLPTCKSLIEEVSSLSPRLILIEELLRKL